MKLPPLVILAGGLGTRLRPVVSDVPKPMAPIDEKPFLEMILEIFRGLGFDDIILCVGFQWERIESHFKDGTRWGVHIRYSIENKPLGTGGALKLLSNSVKPPFIAINGDTLPEYDIAAFVNNALQRKQELMTLGLLPASLKQQRGFVNLDDHNKISSFEEKKLSSDGTSETALSNAGIYVCHEGFFEIFKEFKPDAFSLETEIFPILARKGLLGGLHLNGSIVDIGLPQDYLALKNDPKRVL